MKKLLNLILITSVFVSCTDNRMARLYGGSKTINLPVGKKLLNLTWKEDDMWLLTTDMKPVDSAQVYQFEERSSWGVVEGTVTIVETKPKFTMIIE